MVQKKQIGMFRSTSNKTLDRHILYNYIKEISLRVEELNKKVFVHPLRHTAGFRLSDRNIGVAKAQDFLGHSNVNTTRIYYKKSKKSMEEIAEMGHYKKHFNNKVIFCNCDNPRESIFF